MFKLIFFLIGLAITITFSALNSGNITDISFGFRVLPDVSVFFSTMIAFLAGAVFTLPFAFYVSHNKKKVKKQNINDSFIDDNLPADFTPVENDVPKPE
jgi:nucleoside permease NupC